MGEQQTDDGTGTIVLASASVSRAAMLRAAGVPLVIEAAHVDEDAIKRSFSANDRDPAVAATCLAEAKAITVSIRRPGRLIIGSDQLLVCDSAWFDKPATVDDARIALRNLRGRTHWLYTAVVAAIDRRVVWQHLAVPALTMRPFSDAFLETYLAAGGDTLLASVGAYRLEGDGIQLFTAIDGDYFSVLGLPLLPLIGFLRDAGYLSR